MVANHWSNDAMVTIHRSSLAGNQMCFFQVAGALFVYQREAAPKYGFMIMNRNSKENMVEVVTTELTFQVEIS